MKVQNVAAIAAIAYVSFLTGSYFERNLSWKPVENDVWQKQVITRSGIVKITVDYSHSDPWLTVRKRCPGTPTRDEVYDFIVGSQAASRLDCDGKNSDTPPDPRWRDWFKDAPRPPTQARPAQPDPTQPIHNGCREPKSFGLV